MFSPCAVGGTLNDETIPRLKAEIVAGAANNQLGETRHAQALASRGITYLPDYVANGGGLVSCAAEWYRTDPSRVAQDVRAIRQTCDRILSEAEEHRMTTAETADGIARRMVAQAKRKTLGSD